MVKALFDTNILIDHLNAVPEAASELRRYEQRAISIVTDGGVVGARPEVMADTRTFLGGLNVIALDGAVAERAVKLRRLNRIRCDAIFWQPKSIPCCRHAQHEGLPIRYAGICPRQPRIAKPINALPGISNTTNIDAHNATDHYFHLGLIQVLPDRWGARPRMRSDARRS